MDLSQIMGMAQKLKEQMAEAEAQADRVHVVGEAGGGLVKVTMSGRMHVQRVQIDPKCLKDDPALLEDLVRAAVNDGVHKVTQELQGNMGAMARGMGIDLSALGLGGPKP